MKITAKTNKDNYLEYTVIYDNNRRTFIVKQNEVETLKQHALFEVCRELSKMSPYRVSQLESEFVELLEALMPKIEKPEFRKITSDEAAAMLLKAGNVYRNYYGYMTTYQFIGGELYEQTKKHGMKKYPSSISSFLSGDDFLVKN